MYLQIWNSILKFRRLEKRVNFRRFFSIQIQLIHISFHIQKRWKNKKKFDWLACLQTVFFFLFKTSEGINFGNDSYTTLSYPGWKYHMRFSAGSDSGTFGRGMVKNLIFGLIFTTHQPIRAQIQDFVTQENETNCATIVIHHYILVFSATNRRTVISK